MTSHNIARAICRLVARQVDSTPAFLVKALKSHPESTNSFSTKRCLWTGFEKGKAEQKETRSAWAPGVQGLPGTTVQEPEAAQAPGLAVQNSHMVDDIARVLEGPLGIQPGRNCVVGEGLASADLGLFIDGYQVALQLEPASVSNKQLSAKEYAEARTKQRVLQSFGWAVTVVSEEDWAAAGEDDHKKVHLLVTAINKALGRSSDGKKVDHQHHSGCGSGCGH